MSEVIDKINSWGKLEVNVTKVTTAVILAGPKYIGSFGDDASWRVGLTCQVVDGGSNGPFLICNMPGRIEHTIPWHDLDEDSGVSAVLLALAVYFGNGHILGLLEDTHNVYFEDGQMLLARFYELAPEVRLQLFKHLTDVVKIAVVNFAEDSSLTPRIAQQLSDGGISTEFFARQAFSG